MKEGQRLRVERRVTGGDQSVRNTNGDRRTVGFSPRYTLSIIYRSSISHSIITIIIIIGLVIPLDFTDENREIREIWLHYITLYNIGFEQINKTVSLLCFYTPILCV